MASLAIEADQRHRRFHAEIARRADLVPRREEQRSYSIPNTPFGIKKIAPKKPVQIVPIYRMWFEDLIEGAERRMKPAAPLSIDDIQAEIAHFYDVSKAELLSPVRTAELVRARQVAYYLCRQLTQRSLPDISRRFGGRDHSTVHHGNQKIADLIARDAILATEIEKIKAALVMRLA